MPGNKKAFEMFIETRMQLKLLPTGKPIAADPLAITAHIRGAGIDDGGRTYKKVFGVITHLINKGLL